MEIQVLKHFLAVAQEENISHAAEFLHISQPTLSRQMIQLGDEFGKKLFVRSGKRMLLTQDGVLLRKRATQILELVEKTESEMREQSSEVAGNIYFAASESNMIRSIFQLTTEFRSQYPNICYRMLSGSNEAVMDMVHRGSADFGLAYGEIDASRFESIPLKESGRWGVLAKKDSQFSERRWITAAELRELPLILNQSMSDTESFKKWIGTETNLQLAGTFNMLVNAQMMVEGGLGYAVITDNLISYKNSDLVFIPLKPELKIPMSIIWKHYQVFSAPSAAFLSALNDILSIRDE